MGVFDDMICICMDVNKENIVNAIRERQLKTVEEVGDITEAGTNCGACREEIEDLLNEVNGK